MDGSANVSLLMSGKLPMSGLARTDLASHKLQVIPRSRISSSRHLLPMSLNVLGIAMMLMTSLEKEGGGTQNLLRIRLVPLCVSWRVLIRSKIHDVILKQTWLRNIEDVQAATNALIFCHSSLNRGSNSSQGPDYDHLVGCRCRRHSSSARSKSLVCYVPYIDVA
jgi:hypothetical protein